MEQIVSAELAEADRVRLLEPPAADGPPVAMVLDTDTYNEIDDQYALAYALLATNRVRLDAVYAAPFHNERSAGPDDGMRKSYEEICRVLDRFGRAPDGFVFEGSRSWMTDLDASVTPPAVDDLIQRAMNADEPLYVVAIGAPTNVASALVAAPQIANRIVVVWLGGNPWYWPRAVEFNVLQDMAASRILFESGVPLVHVPCRNVTEHVQTTLAEVDRYIRPTGKVGAYLAEIFEDYFDDHTARSKPLWDLGAVAWLIDPAWVPSDLVHSPVLTGDGRWSHDPGRHLIREANWVNRDAVFGDLIARLS